MAYSQGELERLSNMIGLIYEGATNPSRWSKDIISALADYMQVPIAFLLSASKSPEKDGGFFFSHGVPQEAADRFLHLHFQDIPWVEPSARRGLISSGNVIVGTDVLSTEDWMSSRFYNDCLNRSKDMTMMMSGIVFGLEAADYPNTALALYRGSEFDQFDESERSRVKLLLPHLSHAIGVMNRLNSIELTLASTLSALDRLPASVFLLNERGHVAFANSAAQRMLEQGDGIRLRQDSTTTGLGLIDAGNSSSAGAIQKAILTALRRDPFATAHFSKSVQVPRLSGRGAYSLQFSSLGNHNEFGGGASGYQAIVFVSDSAQEIQIAPSVLRDAYGLTQTEATVANTLLAHDSAKDVGKVLNVSTETVRSHIKQIYAKFGVDSRTRFVKVMYGLINQTP